ncbi:MAG: hypothetical protein U1F27_15645 [Turneriella sp.]
MRRISLCGIRGAVAAIFTLVLLLLPRTAQASDFEKIFTDQFDKNSVWQWLLGDKSYATIDYGYWYAWWIPQSLGYGSAVIHRHDGRGTAERDEFPHQR